MQQLLWFISSASMLTLIGLIAFRAVYELILPFDFVSRSPKHKNSNPAEWLIPFSALLILWLGNLAGHLLAGGDITGFFLRFLDRFIREGDAPRYLFLAQNGYVSEGEEIINIVFYPLYPLLIRLFAPLFGGSFVISGIVISQLCFAAASLVFYKLAKLICPSPVSALLAFLLYPFGFFSLGVFSEGLFLFLSVSGLYYLLKKRWLLAGIMGFLCALTRVQGILLLLPGVYLAWREARENGFRCRMLAVLSPILAFSLYLCLNKLVCGDYFAFSYYESQPPWWQTPQWLGKTLAQQWELAFLYNGIAKWIYWPQLFLFFIAMALLLFAYYRKQENAVILYGGAYLGMCYTASWLISGGRYVLGCVPMHLAVGSIRHPFIRYTLLALELAFFLLFNTYFMQGQCIM